MTSACVSVVICGYADDRWDDLLTAVESVRAQSVPPREIIVVIDHNPSLRARAQAVMPDVTVIENRDPRGLSGARNSGVAVAKGEVIAFLDDDAVAAPDWLERLRAHYEQDPTVLGVGGAIDPAWSDGPPQWFPEEFYWVVGCTYRGMPQTVGQVRNLIGANMSFRRQVFEGVGEFRSGIGRIDKRPFGCEETELCIRAHRHWPDRIFLYDPAARIRHRVPHARARWGYFRARCYAEGRSKAQVTRLAGARDGLETERGYTLRTLPQGMARGIAAAAGGDAAGLARAGAIAAGLAITLVGYAEGLVRSRWRETGRAAGPRADVFHGGITE